MIAIIITVFVVGYALIALEHPIRLNKAASALITGVVCWTVYILFTADKELVNEQLLDHLGDISGILFFLLGAMTIVELIDAHDAFEVITKVIRTQNKRKLLWIISFITFFLSAVLDNLTTTIVMVSILRKLLYNKQDRLLFCGMVIIAANAGGAWSPIGDVTTTMLWIGGQITAATVVSSVLIPSLVCMLLPMIVVGIQLRGNVEVAPESLTEGTHRKITQREKIIVFASGIGMLLMVPVFKTYTHLPPFMGMLLGLGIMWVITEFVHSGRDTDDKHFLSVLYALRKIDTPSILFFLGILVSVAALEAIGVLHHVAAGLQESIGDINLIVITIGVLSSIVDNVPLVAAAMGMYGLETYPQDHFFWQFLAYCAGTGGSILIIGSAAGVAAMGLERIEFFWYLKKIAWLALIGYLAGALVFIAQHQILT